MSGQLLKRSLKNIIGILKIAFQITQELFGIIIIKALLSALQPFVNIIFSQIIIDEWISTADSARLASYAVMTVLLNSILLFMAAVLSKRKSVVNHKFNLQFEKKLNFHQMNLEFEVIESNQLKSLQRNMEQIRMRNGGPEMVFGYFETLVNNLIKVALVFFSLFRIFHMGEATKEITFWTSIWPLLILLFLTVLSVIGSFELQARQNIKIAELNEQANQANGSAFQYMELISDYHFGKDIRVYGLASFLCSKFSHLWKSSIGYRLTRKLGHEKAKIPCITSVCSSFLIMLVYILAIMKSVKGEISAGAVLVYISSIQIFMQSVMELVNSVSDIIGFGILMKPYLEVLALPEEEIIGTQEDNVSNLSAEPCVICFEHVSFRYPDSEAWVLQDVSFTIAHAQRTALVGENGSGKSTIVKLLCRLYEPQKGRITWSGTDIAKLNLQQYRTLLSVVFQDFSLPSFRLGECVACSEHYLAQKVQKALGSVGVPEIMTAHLEDSLYKKFDTDGVEVSGGEAQKTAIARAVYKDSPLVILDEPTAALDPRAEAEIYENFDKMILGKTAVYISHRLSSCRFCYNIIVLDHGRTAQIGTHEELVNQPGQYRKMWETQAGFYKI